MYHAVCQDKRSPVHSGRFGPLPELFPKGRNEIHVLSDVDAVAVWIRLTLEGCAAGTRMERTGMPSPLGTSLFRN